MRFCIHSSQYDPANHTIISGPYSTIDQCNTGCGTTTTTSTTSTTTTTSTTSTTRTTSTTSTTRTTSTSTSTSTSTTAVPIQPNGISPPLLNGTYITNINDVSVTIDIQWSSNGGVTWAALISTTLGANQVGDFNYGYSRIRARANIAGVGTSDWATDDYNYPNYDNILLPSVNGTNVTNLNLFPVFADIQYSSNGGSTWNALISTTIGAGATGSYNYGYPLIRARFANQGTGTSVTPWTT